MITSSQTIDRDTLNRAFVSKTATGTQIAAGSLHLLGSFQVDGATTLGTTTTGSLTTGAINAGANNITTTGTISGTFSGSGASITSLNGSNISSGTVADARLSTNIMLLNGAQTITGAKTMNAALYFANGTTYYVDTSANAKFNSITNSGTYTSNVADGGVLLKHTVSNGDSWVFQESGPTWGFYYHNNGTGTQLVLGDYTTNGSEFIGAAGTNITNSVSMNVASVTGAQSSYAAFSLSLNGGNIWAAGNIQSMNTLVGNYLDIRNEIKHNMYNEFPDPVIASNSTSMWSVTRGTLTTTNQAPSTISAYRSFKFSASQPDAYAIYNHNFPVNPNDWITYSIYGYAGQTNVNVDVYILFFDANNNQIAVPSWTGTLATSWTRYSVTAQAPSNASYFKVRFDNNSGNTTYSLSSITDADATANTGSVPTLSNGTGWTATDTITFVIGTGPVISSITGSGSITYTAAQDATTATTYHITGSNGSKFDLSIVGGVANDNWKFTVTQNVVTTDTYWTGLQVERGRAMTGFKPFGGSVSTANFFQNGVKLASGGEIHSAYNDNFIIKDHSNGHITLSAAGGSLYLGYQNTSNVKLYSNLVSNDPNGNKTIADTAGKLYYQGNDIDSRYLALAGGTMTGTLTMGTNNVVGNLSGYYLSLSGGATLSSVGNTTITADSDSSSTTEALTMQAGKNILKVTSSAGSTNATGLTYNGSTVWHSANDGSGSGLDADLLDGNDSSYYSRRLSAHYTSVSGDTGADGWYSLFQVGDNNNAPVLCHIRAYAHTSASFIVSKGYSTNGAMINLLQVNISSTNGAYKYLKGIRILTDGTVEVKLNGGASVDINVNLFTSGNDVVPNATLVNDTTASPSVAQAIDPLNNGSVVANGNFYSGTNLVWHQGNDGSGSGLDADLLDGLDSTKFVRVDTSSRIADNTKLYFGSAGERFIMKDTTADNITISELASIKIAADSDSSSTTENATISAGQNVLKILSSGASSNANNLTYNGQVVWHNGNDGSGSGLDADKLDGLDSTQFVRNDADTTVNANLIVNSNSGGRFLYIGRGTSTTSQMARHGVDDTTYSIYYNNDDSIGTMKFTVDNTDTVNSGTGVNANTTVLQINGGTSPTLTFQNNTVWHAGNDGSGSGLDADTLDSLQSTSFARTDTDSTITGNFTMASAKAIQFASNTAAGLAASTPFALSYGQLQGYGQINILADTDGSHSEWLYLSSGYPTAAQANGLAIGYNMANFLWKGNTIWHAGNDGAGSGLDADTLDGIDSTRIVYGVNNTATDNSYTDFNLLWKSGFYDVYNGTNTPAGNTGWFWVANFAHHGNSSTYRYNGQLAFLNGSSNAYIRTTSGDAGASPSTFSTSAWAKIWTDQNDGSGSLLDADTVDGLQASQFMRNDQNTSINGSISFDGPGTTTNQAFGIKWTAFDKEGIGDLSDAGHIIQTVNSGGLTGTVLEISQMNDTNDGINMVVPSSASGVRINGYTVWHSGNDGSGSGLDADTLDTLDSSKFMRTDTNTSTSGNLSVTGTFSSSGLPALSSTPGSYREGGQANYLSRLSGRNIVRNSDFIQNNTSGYNIYDNNSTGRVTYSIISDDTIPNQTGKLLRVSYDYTNSQTSTSPNYGGFFVNLGRTTGNPTTWGYRAGNRLVWRVVANIPVGKNIDFASNATGSGGGAKWITPVAGTGNWQEYIYIQTIGNTGTFSTTGFFDVYDSSKSPVTSWSTWAGLTSYAAAAKVAPTTKNGLYYTANAAGTSSGSQPSWPTADGGTVQDKPANNWAASTAYAVNSAVNPTTANGFFYQCTTAGTSTGTQPTWPTTAGSTVNDSAGTSTWVASTAYAANALVVPTTANGLYYKCTTAGTSGTAAPTWPTTSGSTVTDGTAVWTAYAIAVWTARAIITWTAHTENFTWDIAICEAIDLDSVPDVDRAPNLNVGYKQADIGWGEIYSTGKISTDLSLNAASLSITGNGGLPNTIQSSSGAGVLNVYGVGDSYGTGTVLWVKNDSTNTNNNYARFTADFNGTPVHFLDIMYAGTNQVTLNNTSGGGININGGAVTTGSTLTVAGGNLTINKSGNWSYISFPAQTNDRGFIGHYENNNASEMRFVVSDDAQDTDYFTFGAQTGTTTTISGIQAGSWTEGARITAAGNATFKGLTVNGAATVTGNLTTNAQLSVGGGNSYGISLDGNGIKSIGTGELALMSNEIRIGRTASAWDYSKWGGLKYDDTLSTFYIGGPASANFKDSSTPVPRITISFEGTTTSNFDGKMVVNDNAATSIGGTTMANASVLVGTTANGLGLDVDEIASSGSALYLETIGAYNITLKPNNSTVLDVSTTGAAVTGTITSTGNATFNNAFVGQSVTYPTYAIFANSGFSSGTGYALIQDNTGVTILNSASGKDLYFRIGNADMMHITSGGSVGVGTTAPSYKFHVTGDIYANGGWVRTSGSAGWYSETYGGGWYMTDSTWIRNYNSKQVYINATTRLDNLQVGTGTTSTPASDLTVSGSSFNYRNTIWSDGNHSAIRKTSGAHSLDVYSNVAWEGINLQTSDDTLSMGYNFQNSGGSYAWSMSRVNSSTASYPDLVFYGGNASAISGLPEVLRLYHSKGMKLQGNAMIAGTSAMNQDPSITLALGDSDTGFNWTSDGNFNVMANNVAIANISSSQIQSNVHIYNASSHFSLGQTSGRGFRFWNSDAYKIAMSATSDSTNGGSISTVTNSDYNMYFIMQGGGTNRGYAFKSNNGVVAQIDQQGEVHSSTGFRTNNFAMEYNSTEDSLDFVYYG